MLGPHQRMGMHEQGREEFWRDGGKTSSWPIPQGTKKKSAKVGSFTSP